MKRVRFAILLFAILVWLSGCNNEDSTRFDFGWNARIVEDQLRAEGFFTSQFKFLFRALNDSAVLLGTSDWFDSANISRQGNQITLKYESTRVCPDGVVKNGRVFINYQGLITEESFTATMTFGDDYLYAGKRVEGTLELRRLADSLGSVPVLSYAVVNGKIHLESEFEYAIRYNSAHSVYWIGGFTSPALVADDRFVLKGGCSGNGREHDSFRSTIVDSLWLQPGCNYLRGGHSQFLMAGLEVSNALVNYMNKDTCSSLTKVVFSGISSKGDPVVSTQFPIRIGF